MPPFPQHSLRRFYDSSGPASESRERLMMPMSTAEETEDQGAGIDGNASDLPAGPTISEKQQHVFDVEATSVGDSSCAQDAIDIDERRVIVTGADAARWLLPMRDDGDPAFTFRSLFLATLLSAFQSVMNQIYQFKPTLISIQGTFIVIIAYFLGQFWTTVLPRGDLLEARWHSTGKKGNLPLWIKFFKFINNGKWGLKEHSICAITANSASNVSASVTVFAASKLFYNAPLTPTTVILSVISIGLFGYGICGVMRSITVWHVEAVYWGNLPMVKTLQGMHWQDVKNSRPIRYFWYAYGSMFFYEYLPAYIWPWLNSVSIPCLASMHATGSTAAVLTNLFGGATNNEGLGLFTLSFDWQYITSAQTSLPLKTQIHQAVGFAVCMIAMLGIYYGNVWDSLSQPFMSTALRTEAGGRYPTTKVFVNGILDQAAFAEYGVPMVAGTFAYALFMANAAIGAMIIHCILFWGKDIVKAFKSVKQGKYDDRHHEYMAAHYKETPWWWYVAVLVVSFVLGLIVVVKEDIGLPIWAYVVSLIVGSTIAPFSTLLYSRYGNGIATNNLSKMLAGLMVPARPVANMYFAAWSHNVVSTTVNLSGDLKMGEYLKISPRVMFLTQIWGTVFGGFINYLVMISIITANGALLVEGNGNSSWSGATIQSYNTNATSWALAKYLFQAGDRYYIVPMGLVVGAAAVVAHRIVVIFVPRIGTFSLREINLPQFIQYAGFIPYNQTQTSVILSWILCGFFVQYYLRNYRPVIFKDYSYLVMAAWDGASLTALFILSFAVFGAGGPSHPFPQWWGNNVNGNYDLCPVPDL